MGIVIIRKNDKIVKLSEEKFKRLKIYKGFFNSYSKTISKEYNFDNNVISVLFDKCSFSNSFVFNLSNQTIIFNNCSFEYFNLKLTGGSLISDNSSFVSSSLITNDSNLIRLNLTKDSRLLGLDINAKQIDISGDNLGWPDWYLEANTINIKNLSLSNRLVNFTADNLSIDNSSIISNQQIFLNYKDLYFNNSTLESKENVISFSKISTDLSDNKGQYKNVATYYNNGTDSVIINDNDLIDEKKKCYYSLLSILRTIKNQTFIKENEQKREHSKKMDNQYQLEIDKINQQILALEQQKKELTDNYIENKHSLEQSVGLVKVKKYF